jgi:hypothetical protein
LQELNYCTAKMGGCPEGRESQDLRQMIMVAARCGTNNIIGVGIETDCDCDTDTDPDTNAECACLLNDDKSLALKVKRARDILPDLSNLCCLPAEPEDFSTDQRVFAAMSSCIRRTSFSSILYPR